MPERWTLASDFAKPELEHALLAALAANPDLYWQTIDLLHPDAFTEERRQIFMELAAAIEQGKPLSAVAVEGPEPASDPLAAARKLADLHQRRLMADLLEQAVQELRTAETAPELISRIENGLMYVQQVVRELRIGQARTLADILPDVLRDLESRRQAVKAHGTAAVGLPTGISKLDKLLGGLQPGIHLLAGEPGMGKTTFALQVAAHVARKGTPALFVSFEESEQRLALKAICQAAGLVMKRYADGLGDPADVAKAAQEHGPALVRLHLMAGTRRTAPAHIKARALQVMHRHGAERCLIVVDYLQRWAATVEPEALEMGDSQRRRAYMEFRHTVSALVSELRELAFRLDSPLLVISSQNRSGQGDASLTSLKESGDLEYSADSAWFLVASKDRPATPPARAVDLALEKNRYGDKGRVELIFKPDVGTFAEVVQVDGRAGTAYVTRA